ncbi:MAG: HPP family protein, partial [Paludibacteraceae bacterium]
FVLAILMVIPVFGEYRYCILPPLVVTYVEFANTKSGFRDRPIQVFFSIVAASVIGATLHFAGLQIGIPAAITALFISTCIFFLFERFTSPFAPAAAIGFIPLIVPQEDLLILPLQVTIGAAILITVALLLYVIYPSRLTA